MSEGDPIKKVKASHPSTIIGEEDLPIRLKRADFLFSRLKIKEALDIYDEILKIDKNNTPALNGKGNCLRQLGMRKEALDCFVVVLTINPSDVTALYNTGLIYKESDRLSEAIITFEKALASAQASNGREITTNNQSLYPSVASDIPIQLAQILTDFGTRLKLLGSFDQAMEKYIQATQLNSAYAPAFYNIGVIYSELGKYEEALKYYQSSIENNPFYVEAYCNVGVIYKNMGRLEDAIIYYGKALSVNPNFAIARNNMAIALTDFGTKLKNEGKLKEGIKQYKKALLYNYQYPDAYYNLGVAYGEVLKYDKAIVCYELSIHFNPVCCEAYNNLGVIYKDQDNLDKAIQCYQAALTINPSFSQTLNNIGVVYTVQGKMDEAILSIRSAIQENPMYGEAYNNLGVLYRDEGDIDQAIACYEKCLEITPTSRNAAQNRLLAMNYSEKVSLEDVFDAHKIWGEMFQQHFRRFSQHRVDMTEDKVLRIGYISPDFFTHSVSYFIEALLANHDKENFVVVCYSNVVREDAKTLKLKKMADLWRNVQGLGAEQTANLVINDKIDILVELTGHTAGNRLDVLAMKPAPIQITYIGYPNTTGLKTIDYRFTDATADPVDTKQQYTEELIRLPKCFLCYTPSSDSVGEAQLPYMENGFITFGSFNNLAKINPSVISLWASILIAVPNSRLVVKCKPFASLTIRQKFLNTFKNKGVDPSRIDLLNLVPLNFDHLQSYQLMDLSLDTFPYAGTTTTCESLWMGVPVVTLRGETHAQNVGVSLLSVIGYDFLIANTKEEYINIAVKLATDIPRLKSIRESLRNTMKQSPLCDGDNFTRNLENTYRSLWKRYISSGNSNGHEE